MSSADSDDIGVQLLWSRWLESVLPKISSYAFFG